jgi:hypothetical protein
MARQYRDASTFSFAEWCFSKAFSAYFCMLR